MEQSKLIGLNPTMDMVAEYLEDAGWECRRFLSDPAASYRGILPYTGQGVPEPDILYLLPQELSDRFPTGTRAYVSACAIPGSANHLTCPGKSPKQILQVLLEMFSKLQALEAQLNQLLFSESSLDELCQLGQRITGQAVCIHDDWFVLIAMSEDAQKIMPPERIASSALRFVPRQVLEEFKFDPDYGETYESRRCQLWVDAGSLSRCLYVNLWQDNRYRGRLLLFESQRAFRSMDYLIADCLAQRAMLLLRQPKPGGPVLYRNLDDLIGALLAGDELDPVDLRFLLSTLHWQENDDFVCIRLQNQQEGASEVLGHVLHSDLFRVFSSSYVMYLGIQQCIVLNIRKDALSMQEIRYRLSPICRDYYLYAGFSSPVTGISALHQAAEQASIALNQAFYHRDQRWLLAFSDCAMDYLLTNIQSGLEPRYLAAPEWLTLLRHDQEKDTQYFETLRAWLRCERNIPETAQKLIIHRTTLVYRLKKIAALIGPDLDDPQRRLYLLLSLHLLELHRLVPEDDVSFS